jgi:hypothetical protein
MAISGLWHGAGWQFIVWGILHGVYLTINQGWRLLSSRWPVNRASYDRVMRPVGRMVTFLAVALGLVFFRSGSVASAMTLLGGLFGRNGVLPNHLQLFQDAGAGLSWAIVKSELPVDGIWWILALFPVVMFLPNSLELLRRFCPALDFPQVEDPSSKPPASAIHPPLPMMRDEPVLRRNVLGWWEQLRRIPKEGVNLSKWTAVIAALLCMLGATALTRGGGFLYGQF